VGVRALAQGLFVWFLPPQPQRSVDDDRRMKLLIGVCLTFSVLGPVFMGLSWFLYDLPVVALVTGVAVLFAVGALGVLRRTGSVAGATLMVSVVTAGAVLGISGAVEGLTSPALAWLCVFPVVTMLVLGVRAGVGGSLLCLAGLGVMVACDRLGLLPNHELQPELRRTAATWNYALLIVVTSVCAALAESFRVRAMRALTQAHAQLDTERQQRIVSERMASLGTLAAGVAHEINNPLTFVFGNLEFALERLAALREAKGLVELTEPEAALRDALDGSRRVHDIVRDMKTFSRVGSQQAEPIDPVEVFQVALRMAGNLVKHRAHLAVDFQRVPKVRADPSQLAQVLVNLVSNAVQALPDRDMAHAQLKVAATCIDREVVLAVSDNGEGMTPAVQARIFEPFFTTKGVGAGTGLGLFICNNLVTAMHGRIALDSQPGVGTTMRVILPAADDAQAAPPSAVAPAPKAQALRVLIIDDEPLVGSVTARLLPAGCVATCVTSAAQALERLREQPFDAVLCDVMMPELDGIGFYEALQAQAPALAPHVGFISGGGFTPSTLAFIAGLGPRCLGKPFTREELAQLLHTLTQAG
jgi:signal transduction histidine kinase